MGLSQGRSQEVDRWPRSQVRRQEKVGNRLPGPQELNSILGTQGRVVRPQNAPPPGPNPAVPVAEHVTRGNGFILCLGFPNWRRGATSPSPTFQALVTLGSAVRISGKIGLSAQRTVNPLATVAREAAAQRAPRRAGRAHLLPRSSAWISGRGPVVGLHVPVPPNPCVEAWTPRVAVS